MSFRYAAWVAASTTDVGSPYSLAHISLSPSPLATMISRIRLSCVSGDSGYGAPCENGNE